MKNYIATLAIVVMIINASGQNYTIDMTYGTSPVYQYSNPGTVIIERPAVDSIVYDDTLSAWQTLPFSWSFFGSEVNGYYISENGYITFDQNATESIGNKTDVPETGGPDNAIYAFWEDLVISKRSSLNDKIRTWTYGTIPQRVHVIQWYCVKPAANNRYLNMAIRIYECGDFDIVFSNGSGFGFSSGTIGCENSDGTKGVSVTGSPDVGYPKVTTPQADDVVYTFYYDQINYDLSVNYNNFSDYVPLGDNNIEGTLINKGGIIVTSLDLNYQINNSSVQTMNINSINIPAFGGTYNFSHNIPWNVSNSGENYTVKIWADNINGNSDERTCNDTNVTEIFSGISGDKKVLIEEFTYTTCGFCPDGMLRMDSLIHQFPGRVFGVSVHRITTTDLMGFNGAMDIINTFKVTGYPTGMVDRILYPGNTKEPFTRYDWKSATKSQLTKYTPLNVSISSNYNSGTRVIDATVTADFVDDAGGNMRFVFMVIEDSVTGDGNYDQKSYFNNSAGHPYYGMGDVLKGYVHKHVLRAIPSGATGNAGVIPTSVAKGSSYSENFSYTVPDSYDIDQISLIGFVANYGSVGEKDILNVAQVDIYGNAAISEYTKDRSFLVYPNPANDRIIIKTNPESNSISSVRIHNMMGQAVFNLTDIDLSKTGKLTLDVNELSNGVYLISLDTEEGTLTEKILISR